MKNTYLIFLSNVIIAILQVIIPNNALAQEDEFGAWIKQNGIKRYYSDRLFQEGDYSKLKFFIHSNKKIYQLGEPIVIRLGVKNESDSYVNINLTEPVNGPANQWKIIKDNQHEVPKTLAGQKILPKGPEIIYGGGEWEYVRLEAGGEENNKIGKIFINRYFDFSLPGTYKIVCSRSTFFHGQKYNLLLESNTLEIQVKNEYYFKITNFNDFVADEKQSTIGILESDKPQVLASGFRQLTNQEIAKIYYERMTSGEKLLKKRQWEYDNVLAFLSSKRSYNDFDLSKIDVSFLKQLQWIIETNKKEYSLGEPVEIKLFLKNFSEKDVVILKRPLPTTFMLSSIQLKRVLSDNEVYLTKEGFRLYCTTPGHIWGPIKSKGFISLKPNEQALTDHWLKTLNDYYDLSKSGEYELTFYTRNYIGDNQIAEFPKPCTIRFKIKKLDNWQDEQIVWQENNHDL
jgi:hypothetical protein